MNVQNEKCTTIFKKLLFLDVSCIEKNPNKSNERSPSCTAHFLLWNDLPGAGDKDFLARERRRVPVSLAFVSNEALLVHNVEDLCQDGQEGSLNIGRFQSWSLQEEKPFFLCKFFGVLGGDRTLALEIAFVSYQNDDYVLVCVVTQLFKPTWYVIEGLPFGYVIDQHCPNSTSIVCARHGPVSAQTSWINWD